MINSVPGIGPKIAGISAFNVNTRRSGNRCAATGSARKVGHDTPGKSNGWTKIKRRAAIGVGAPPTALTRPASHTHKGREGQAVSKPMTSFYVTGSGLAVTIAGQLVIKSTESVVAP